MASDWRTPRNRAHDDGVRVTPTRGRSAVIPGLLLVGVVGWLVVRTLRSEASRPVPPPPVKVSAVRRAADASAPPIAAARDPELGERMRQRREERKEKRREKSEAPFTLNAPGEQAGIAAFPPAGTKPIKRGIVVPDDFELPEGYVRHYQTTDDGRPLPPILMFHPDFAGVDENGNPVVVPEDRVVPPELAPPGLRQRTLDETTDIDERTGRRVHSDSAPSTGRR
jgi:hypothetical protein